MQKRFYVDTSVWRDLFEDRSDGLKPLGEFAFQFLKKCFEHKCALVYSEPIERELTEFPKNWFNEVLFNYKELLIYVNMSKNQVIEAKHLSKTRNLPKYDCLHAILARDNKAILISRDRHFLDLQDVVESALPEEIIF